MTISLTEKELITILRLIDCACDACIEALNDCLSPDSSSCFSSVYRDLKELRELEDKILNISTLVE